MSIPPPIHPFPARMAPSIALKQVQQLRTGSVVLDPMMGSGMVVRAASDAGHHAIGRDVDPLAVLMTRVWTTPVQTPLLLNRAEELVASAQLLPEEQISLPWIDEDVETRQFIQFWFASPQCDQLRRLCCLLADRHDAEADALRIALSRIIITKNRGASLARDVSHSRPHRAFEHNTYDVYEGFLRSTRHLIKRFEQAPPQGHAQIDLGDARQLTLPSGSVDAVITSPPYLNAIDYLRGHRLALVWLGYRVGNIRAIRSGSIGAERALAANIDTMLATRVIQGIGIENQLPPREQRIFERYVFDLAAMLGEIYRVLKPGGRAVFVLGNSCMRGIFVRNSDAVLMLAEESGFELSEQYDRDLPDSRRYLPPPKANATSSIEQRMRKEVVLTFART